MPETEVPTSAFVVGAPLSNTARKNIYTEGRKLPQGGGTNAQEEGALSSSHEWILSSPCPHQRSRSDGFHMAEKLLPRPFHPASP